MQKFRASSNDAQVSGLSLMTLFLGLLKDEYAWVLKDYGVSVDALEEWYPQQFVLDVLRTIKQRVGNQLVMVSVGMTWAGDTPPEFATFDEFLCVLGDIYAASSINLGADDALVVKQNHPFQIKTIRLGGESAVLKSQADLSFVGENHFEVVNSTPYPDDLIYGYLYGNARRYLQKFLISYRDPKKIDGEENMYFDVHWKAIPS